MQNLQTHIPGQSRANKNRIATYAMETWSEAQQESSTLFTHVAKKSMAGARLRLFDTIEKIDFASKNGGKVRTPDGSTVTGRRELRTYEYHVARSTDLSDITDASFDILEESKKEIKKGEGRLMDQVILNAIVAPAQETTAPTIASNSDQIIKATLASGAVFKNAAWATLVRGAANTALTAFASTDLDKVRHIFSLRDVQEEVCCTLTPALELILRQDAQFVNAENRFNATMGDAFGAGLLASQRNFSYKGIRFVYTFRDSLPIISNANIGSATTAPTTRSASTTIYCYGLDRLTDGTRSSRTASLASADANGGIINAASEDIAHFWCPRAVYYGDNPELMFARNEELQNVSYARQIYVRTCLGAMVIDDDHVLSVVLAGSVATQRTGS